MALLFYGCRSLEDELYADSFERWQQLGAVSVRRAYSCAPEQSQGCRHVQERVFHDKAEVVKLFLAGARLAVCVPECAVAGVRQTLIDILKESRVTEIQEVAVEAQSKGGENEVAEHQLEGAWHVWNNSFVA